MHNSCNIFTMSKSSVTDENLDKMTMSAGASEGFVLISPSQIGTVGMFSLNTRKHSVGVKTLKKYI